MPKQKEHNYSPTYISLFSCAGVGCYGFKMAGFSCIYIASFTGIERWKRKEKLKKVDAIIVTPPCQRISVYIGNFPVLEWGEISKDEEWRMAA